MRSIKLILGLCLISILTGNCKKDAQDQLLGPGLVLSIDCPIDTWYPLKDFLKENNIKVTFYYPGYSGRTVDEKRWIAELIADGHEIAHHGKTHANVVEYLKEHGADQYVQLELIPDRDSMIATGVTQRDFAYPFGMCSAETDKLLLNYFNSLRKIIFPYMNRKLEDMDQIYYRYGNNSLFYGCNIDQKTNFDLNDIYDALEKAKDSKQTISLYCHLLSYSPTDYIYSIPVERVKSILLKAKSLDLRFYTVAEISRKKF